MDIDFVYSECVAEVGAHGARETPVSIPNTEVKPSSGEYTAMRENSTVPFYKKTLVIPESFSLGKNI